MLRRYLSCIVFIQAARREIGLDLNVDDSITRGRANRVGRVGRVKGVAAAVRGDSTPELYHYTGTAAAWLEVARHVVDGAVQSRAKGDRGGLCPASPAPERHGERKTSDKPMHGKRGKREQRDERWPWWNWKAGAAILLRPDVQRGLRRVFDHYTRVVEDHHVPVRDYHRMPPRVDQYGMVQFLRDFEVVPLLLTPREASDLLPRIRNMLKAREKKRALRAGLQSSKRTNVSQESGMSGHRGSPGEVGSAEKEDGATLGLEQTLSPVPVLADGDTSGRVDITRSPSSVDGMVSPPPGLGGGNGVGQSPVDAANNSDHKGVHSLRSLNADDSFLMATGKGQFDNSIGARSVDKTRTPTSTGKAHAHMAAFSEETKERAPTTGGSQAEVSFAANQTPDVAMRGGNQGGDSTPKNWRRAETGPLNGSARSEGDVQGRRTGDSASAGLFGKVGEAEKQSRWSTVDIEDVDGGLSYGTFVASIAQLAEVRD